MSPTPRLRVGFAGTPTFATPALRTLCDSQQAKVVAVYTQPDRPAGRGRQITYSPVKQLALERELPVFQPQNFKSPADIDTFKALSLDVLVVAAYGLILPSAILDATEYPLNIHASLLPKWRGAAPIQRAIMAGDKQSGVTIIRITEKLDAGPMWHRLSCEISNQDTAGTLHDKLSLLGARAIEQAIEMIVTNQIVETVQNESLVTYAEKISRDDRELDWEHSALQLARQIRALNPTPSATATIAQQKCKIWVAEPDPNAIVGTPGTIAYASNEGIGICTGDGVLRITQLQPPGKKPLSARDFLNGYGSRLPTLSD